MSNDNQQRGLAIVGPGRIGQALGCLLSTSRVPVAMVAGRNPASVREAVRFIGQGTPVALDDPRLAQASVLLITTSDSAIEPVAKSILRLGGEKSSWKGRVVLHTCGSLPSAILKPFKLKGASIGSLHPYQTVPSPRAGVRNLRGCYWGIEGDPRALRVAEDWIRRLDGVSFRIRAENKGLYHLSAFLACPAVVTLMAESAQLLKRAGVPEKISRPMLAQIVEGAAGSFRELGGHLALTGPAVRGDFDTLARHRKALRKASPEFAPMYDDLVEAMRRVAARKSTPKRTKRPSR
jgi:predicted short-subunit dehydrogenase-like oxidoreductase (DUF2520 family)